MDWNKWAWGIAVAVGMLGLSTQVTASCPTGYSDVAVIVGGTDLTVSYTTTCVATTDPDENGKCAAGKVIIASYQCVKPPDGTIVVGSSGCVAGEVRQGANKCAAVATATMTCPSGTVGIVTTSGNSCASNSPMLATPICTPPKSAISVVDPNANGNCATGYMQLGLITCATSGTGVPADPSISQKSCTCPTGQDYQEIKKCSLLPRTCPAGQGSVITYTTSPATAGAVTQKCVPVTDSDDSGKCPNGQVLITTTLSSPGVVGSDGVPVTNLINKSGCVAGSVETNDGICPANTQSNGNGQCVASLDSSLPTSIPSDTAAPKADSNSTPQSEFGGGGSCSLIR